MSDSTIQKLGTLIKTWLPITITIGGLIIGYFLFKSETNHNFELQRLQTESLAAKVQTLYEQVNEDQQSWKSNIESQITTNRENIIRLQLRLENLEHH